MTGAVLEVEVVVQHEVVVCLESEHLGHGFECGFGVVVSEKPFGADEMPVGHD